MSRGGPGEVSRFLVQAREWISAWGNLERNAFFFNLMPAFCALSGSLS